MPSEYVVKARRAVHQVGVAVRSGRLVRQPCVDCGAEKVQAHHHNGYDREHELDVTWLCPLHHKARHVRATRKPPWDRSGHVRSYMDATRPLPSRYRDIETHAFTNQSSPKRLFKMIEHIWESFRTDEERAWALALVERLVKEGTA